MKIVQVYKDVYPEVSGGIERYIRDLSSFLRSRGHQVEIVVSGGGERTVDDIPVHGVPELCRILSNPVSPGYAGKLAELKADVYHFHLPLPTAVIAWLSLPEKRRRPWVVTYHSDIVRQAFLMPLYGPILRRFLRGAHSVLATSARYRETSRFLNALDNTEIVPIGVDLGRFTPAASSVGNYYLFVGRFRTYKGIDTLLGAWGLMERPPQLVMAGGGAMEKQIRNTVEEHSLPVTVMTDVTDSELVELYRNARALILPSTQRSEAYGMVQLEAMACGTPVISSDLPTGVSWVNVSGETGLSFETGNPSALAEAVITLEDRPGLAARMGEAALGRARTVFDAEQLFGKVEECLKRAAGN